MINTYVSARECRAPCTHTCTRRSKKPCLLINEIFLGQTLMIHLSQWSMRTAGDGSGGIQSRAEARGSLKATNLSNVLHAAIQKQYHSGVRNKQNETKKAIEILESYTHIPLTPIWCSDKLLFEIQWNAPQEKNERKTGEWEVGKARIRHMCLWHLGTLLWCCVEARSSLCLWLFLVQCTLLSNSGLTLYAFLQFKQLSVAQATPR